MTNPLEYLPVIQRVRCKKLNKAAKHHSTGTRLVTTDTRYMLSCFDRPQASILSPRSRSRCLSIISRPLCGLDENQSYRDVRTALNCTYVQPRRSYLKLSSYHRAPHYLRHHYSDPWGRPPASHCSNTW